MEGQHLKNICIYNTHSSDLADHQADDAAEKEESINIPNKQQLKMLLVLEYKRGMKFLLFPLLSPMY